MTEETNVIDALRWRRLRQLAERRVDPAIVRRGAAAAARPARCAGDLAAVAELLLLAEWQAAGTTAVAADLRILSGTVLAFSDQLSAQDREHGDGTAWAGEATAAAAYSLAARDIADLPAARR
jgi:hypothetical protein